jgi:ATP-binding cassette subfamily B protein
MNTFSNNPLVYLFKKMWEYANNNRRSFVLYLGLFVMANIIASLEPLIIGKVLNTIQEDGVREENIRIILGFLGLFVLQELIFWCFHGIARVMENKNAFIVRNNYKEHLLQGTMNLPIEWHVDHHSGDTIDKIEKGTGALFRFATHTFEVLHAIILLITAYVALSFFDIKISLGMVIVTIAAFYVLIRFDRMLIPGYKKVNRLENKISAKVFDVISNVTTVITLRIKTLVLGSIVTHMQEPFPQYEKNIILNEQKWFSASLIGRAALAGMLGMYVFSHWKSGGALLGGTIYILYSYLNQIREAFFKFAYLYGDVVQQRTSVMNAEEVSKDFDATLAEKDRLPKDWKELHIHNLSFSYHRENGAYRHLDQLEMKIQKGQRIAVIGRSGGGKSTFLKVLRDLYHPKTLNLHLDGKPVPKGFAGVSESISLVPQDPEIFATTIRENITLGVEYAENHIEVFTDMARFTEVAKRLPHGLDSSIVEKGVNLSGGEKQRLALARGLLASADKEIVLLDEPTSSVDFHNELEIYRNIFTAFPGKTIISSVHRLHLLSLFDVVYFFKSGKIVASGSFEQLRSTSPDFQAMWNKYIKTREAGTI